MQRSVNRRTWLYSATPTISFLNDHTSPPAVTLPSTYVRYNLGRVLPSKLNKLEAGHSLEYITHAGQSTRSLSLCFFLHFVTLWPWPLTFQSPYHIACTISQDHSLYQLPSLNTLGSFVFELSYGQTGRQTHGRTDRRGRTLYPRLSSAWVTTIYAWPHKLIAYRYFKVLAFSHPVWSR